MTDTRTVAEVLFILHGRAGKSKVFARRLFEETFTGGNFVLQCRIKTARRQVRVNQILVCVGHHIHAFATPGLVSVCFLG